MDIKTKAIVLNKTKYSETSVVVKMFTRETGVQGFMVKGAFGKRGKGVLALLENLSLVEVTFDDHRDGLKYLREISLYQPYSLIPFDMVRRTIFIFYNELIYKLLMDYQPDEAVYDFIEQSLIALDDEKTLLTDVHLRFLVDLSKILGFFPKDNFSEQNCHFSIEEACFVNEYFEYPDYLTKEASTYLFDLMNGRRMEEFPPKQIRNELLYGLLRYYIKHNEQIYHIDSVPILAEILS